MTERKLNASGWCVRNAYCPSQIGCATVSGGRGGELCKLCATDPADLVLFEAAEKADAVLVIEQPDEPGKPWLEWQRNDKPGPNEGMLGIHDGKKLDAYRVDAADALAGRGFKFTKLTSKDKHSYTCVVTYGGGAPVGCECWAWLTRMKCRHTAAAMALLARKAV